MWASQENSLNGFKGVLTMKVLDVLRYKFCYKLKNIFKHASFASLLTTFLLHYFTFVSMIISHYNFIKSISFLFLRNRKFYCETKQPVLLNYKIFK